jgi:hypothetical protein
MTAAAHTADVTAALAEEIDRVRRLDPSADRLGLARLVTAAVHRHGRHRLGEDLLTQLASLTRGHGERDPFLDAHLDAVLARRHDGARADAYLALPLLELIRDDHGMEHERMAALLLADVARREWRASRAAVAPGTRELRIRYAARFVAAVEPTLGLRWLPGPWFALTVLPVSTEHDEYTFLRALQAQEMLFGALTHRVRDAARALRDGDPAAAAEDLDQARAVLGRATMLLGLIATTRRGAFDAFRRYAENVGALRPQWHRRFVTACAAPVADGLGYVPPRRDSVTAAWRATAPRGAAADELRRAAARLEGAHTRWRRRHDALATAMLGPGRPIDLDDLRGERLFDLDQYPPHAVAA